LDVDGAEGDAALLQYHQSGHILPETLTVTTGRGMHLYFKWPDGQPVSNSAGKLAAGLDIRGVGGCAVIPPSVHPSGAAYSYVDPYAPIADAPEWLLALMRKPVAARVTANEATGVREGKRNSTLTSLAGGMRRQGMSPAAIEAALLEQNRGYEPPLEEAEVRGIAASVARYKPAQARRPDVVCLATIEPEAVEWLWKPYIPLKMLTLVSGDPGVGKTSLAMALAARLTRGEGMDERQASEPGNVLYLTQENSPAHVLRPRFDALGGDSYHFFLLRGTFGEDEQPGGITLADTLQLEEAITRHEARLVVIDPLQSFLGAGVDAHRANQTRPVMDGLIRLSERTGCAVVITRHLSKGMGGSALYRGMGSVDITGAARCELLVARDPEDSSRIIMAHSKSNLGPFGPSLAFSIGKDGLVTLCGESSHKADDLLSGPVTDDERSAVEEAQDFLREALSGGPQASTAIQEQAEAQGISAATLRRARKSLGVERKPAGFGKPWMLALPSVAQDSPELLKAGD
jgi:hypothetical protein